jgi:hypothetical protein
MFKIWNGEIKVDLRKVNEDCTLVANCFIATNKYKLHGVNRYDLKVKQGDYKLPENLETIIDLRCISGEEFKENLKKIKLS